MNQAGVVWFPDLFGMKRLHGTTTWCRDRWTVVWQFSALYAASMFYFTSGSTYRTAAQAAYKASRTHSVFVGKMLGSCSKDMMSTIQHGAVRQARMLRLICNKVAGSPCKLMGAQRCLQYWLWQLTAKWSAVKADQQTSLMPLGVSGEAPQTSELLHASNQQKKVRRAGVQQMQFRSQLICENKTH